MTAEFDLVVASCRWPPSSERVAAVRAAAAEALDWDRVRRIAARHRVEGLVNDGLVAADVDMPAWVSEAFRGQARRVARASLELAAESVRLQQRFDAAQAPVMVLKGAAVEQLAYGALGLKSAWDIDLLVSPSSVPTACAILQQAGYDLVEKDGLKARMMATWVALVKECEFAHRVSGVIVELHWRLADSPALLPGLGVTSDAQSVSLAPGAALRTLSDIPLFSYLCVHGAMHGWSRLKWLSDLAALLGRKTPEEIERLYRGSAELGAGLCPAQALLLCKRLFDTALPVGLAIELEADPQARRLERAARRTLTLGGGATEVADQRFETSRIALNHFLLDRGWRYRFAVLRQKWTSLSDRMSVPLPRPLHFLYHVIRLPLWLWRRLHPARRERG